VGNLTEHATLLRYCGDRFENYFLEATITQKKCSRGGMNMATLSSTQQSTLAQRAISGVVGGLAGGIVFGIVMGVGGMLPMVAGLVGGGTAVVGFGVHMVISAILGALFGVALGAQAQTYSSGALWGLGYGLVWWVLGPLVLMPLMMGMGVRFGAALTPPMLMSLGGHLLFGVVTGLVYAWYINRS
jgi:hypothetical protein